MSDDIEEEESDEIDPSSSNFATRSESLDIKPNEEAEDDDDEDDLDEEIDILKKPMDNKAPVLPLDTSKRSIGDLHYRTKPLVNVHIHTL